MSGFIGAALDADGAAIVIATPEHCAGMRRRMAARIHALPEGRDCRLVALTGYGQDADRARSQAAGFERHLVKPIGPVDGARAVAGD